MQKNSDWYLKSLAFPFCLTFLKKTSKKGNKANPIYWLRFRELVQ